MNSSGRGSGGANYQNYDTSSNHNLLADLTAIYSRHFGNRQGGTTSLSNGNGGGNAEPFPRYVYGSHPGYDSWSESEYESEYEDEADFESDSGSGPEPANESVIAALPKIKLGTSKLDGNGKGECGICMDDVAVGDEVTELPCKHWYHDTCIGTWLREHDTCPQCRRGIMPRDDFDGHSDRYDASGSLSPRIAFDPSQSSFDRAFPQFRQAVTNDLALPVSDSGPSRPPEPQISFERRFPFHLGDPSTIARDSWTSHVDSRRTQLRRDGEIAMESDSDDMGEGERADLARERDD